MHLVTNPSIGREWAPNTLNFQFVDRRNFNRLQSAHFQLKDFENLVCKNTSDKVSVTTQAYLTYLDKLLNEQVLSVDLHYDPPAQAPHEVEYTHSAVWQDMTVLESYRVAAVDTDPSLLCYDTIPINDHGLLIVVGDGFLYHLASNKDNYIQFILACIRCMDRFNCDLSQLNKLYLQLRLSGAPYELLRCRIQ